MISPPHRLLIVKPSSFGDILHALPALAALKRAWPETLIDWLVKPEWAELVGDHPDLSEVLPFPHNLATWRAIRQRFRSRPYDMAIDLQGLLRSGIASLLSGAPLRVGFADAREGSRWCYTHAIHIAGDIMHAVDRGLELLRQIGIPVDSPPMFPLPVSPAAEDWLQALWVKEGLSDDRPAVVIHPAARWKTKRWLPERFALLADELGASGAQVILVAGADQMAQVVEMEHHMRGPAVNLAGRTTLLQLAGLLKRATLVISNDSGPMHLAAAVGTPVIALFGPTDPRFVGPYGKAHLVVKKTFDCRACSRQRCAHDQGCLRLITVAEVLSLAVPLLRPQALGGALPGQASGARN